MRRFFTKKSLLTLLPLAAIFFIMPHAAHAGWLDISGTIASGVSSIISSTTEVFILPLASMLMALSGMLMDAAIKFCLNTSYIFSLSPAVNLGWTVMRDISNMFFIFILIYISLKTIISGTGYGTMNALKSVIIAAILINFSLFITKAVVDVSNIFGNWLYGGVQTTLLNNSSNSSTPASLSDLISTRLGIYQFFTGGSNTTANANAPSGIRDYWSDPSKGFIGAQLRLAVVLICTFVFLYIAVMFIARSITILFLLVFSPLGFMGGVLPQIKEYSEEWKKNLSAAATFPVAFLLMLYISIQFINSLGKLPASLTQNSTANGLNVTVYFQYVIIIFLLLASLKVAKKYSGEIGDKMGSIAESLGKLAVGATVAIASGGASMALQGTLGAAASGMAESGAMKNMAASSGVGGTIARFSQKGLKGVAGSSFDVRGTGLLPKAATGKALGIDFAKIGYQKGGYTGAKKDKEDADRKFADTLKATDEEKEAAKPYQKEARNNILMKDADYAAASRKNAMANLAKNNSLAALEAKMAGNQDISKIDSIKKEIADEKNKHDAITTQTERDLAAAEKTVVGDKDDPKKQLEFKRQTHEEEKRIVEEKKTEAQGDPIAEAEALKAEKAIASVRRRETWANTIQEGFLTDKLAMGGQQVVINASTLGIPAMIQGLNKAIEMITHEETAMTSALKNIGAKSNFAMYKEANEKKADELRKDIIKGGFKNKDKSQKDIFKGLSEVLGVEVVAKEKDASGESEAKPPAEAKGPESKTT